MVLMPHCRFCRVAAHIDVSWSRQDSDQSVSMYQFVFDYCLHILPFLLELVTACICLTLKAPNKNCSSNILIFYLNLLKKLGLIFHVNPLPSRGFT